MRKKEIIKCAGLALLAPTLMVIDYLPLTITVMGGITFMAWIDYHQKDILIYIKDKIKWYEYDRDWDDFVIRINDKVCNNLDKTDNEIVKEILQDIHEYKKYSMRQYDHEPNCSNGDTYEDQIRQIIANKREDYEE